MALVVGVLIGLAANLATGERRWPWGLDVIRRHPFPAVAFLVAVAVVLAVTQVVMDGRVAKVKDHRDPPGAPLIKDWVVDREQARKVSALVRRRGGGAVGLLGAGGFGKTTVARLVQADPRVRRHFGGRVYEIRIGQDVRGRAAIAAKVVEVIREITGDVQSYDDPQLAGRHLGQILERRPRTLLVLDDVWHLDQLDPFLIGAERRCVRLFTTRVSSVLRENASRVTEVAVEQMSVDQARRVLTWGLPDLPENVVADLLKMTGEWAILLRLVNRAIALGIRGGENPEVVARGEVRALQDAGPAVLDEPAQGMDGNDRDRDRSVRATIEASLTLLPDNNARERCLELGVFAEDEVIPATAVTALWRARAGMSDQRARHLCVALEDLALISWDKEDGGRMELHDVIREYLRTELGPVGRQAVNGALLDDLAAHLPPAVPLDAVLAPLEVAWWQLREGYLLDYLITHMLDADRRNVAEAVASDLRWIRARLDQRGPTAPIRDLEQVSTTATGARAADLRRIAHLLTPTTPARALTAILYSRLAPLPAWRPQTCALKPEPGDLPLLRNLVDPPDLPDPALRRTLGHTGRMNAVAISPDGTWLATAGLDHRVRIWDRASGSNTATLTGHTSWVFAVAISPDGTWLATAGLDHRVRIWDRASGTLTSKLPRHIGQVRKVAISPDGTWLATAGSDRSVRIWDRASGTLTSKLTGHTKWVQAVAISPDGTWLATASNDCTVRIWDRASGSNTATLTGHTNAVQAVAISPDGTWLATAGSDRSVRIWDRASGSNTAILTGHTEVIWAVAISPDGTWLATASSDHSVRIWDRASGSNTATLTVHTRAVQAVAISPDGTWLATASEDRTVRIWDQDSGTNTAPLPLTSHIGLVSKVAISPDGTWLATIGVDRSVRIWDRASGTNTTTLTGHTDWVGAVAISPDGTWLATASSDHSVRIWDRASGSNTATLTGHTGSVEAVTISPDGTWLATAGDDGSVRIWDRASGSNTATLAGRVHRVLAVAISPDGTWLATASSDHRVRIWDLPSGTLNSKLARYTDWIYVVAISPDGTWLATASSDHSVRIWDRVSGSNTATLTGHTGRVEAVAISPDGTWLATAGEDCSVRIWDRAGGPPIAMLRVEIEINSCVWLDPRTLAMAGGQGMHIYELVVS